MPLEPTSCLCSTYRRGCIGIGKYAARGKQYLVMVWPIGDKGLVMVSLHSTAARPDPRLRTYW